MYTKLKEQLKSYCPNIYTVTLGKQISTLTKQRNLAQV